LPASHQYSGSRERIFASTMNTRVLMNFFFDVFIDEWSLDDYSF